jgi:predicted phage terminase large subunit-like protein
MKFDYYSLLRETCKDSYFEFVKTFWPAISSEKLVVNWHIPYLCNRIQHHMDRVFADLPKERDLVCNISPGTSKSSIFTVLLVPWAWTRMPGLRFIGTSFVEDLSFELTVKSRRVIQHPLYQKLFPEIRLRTDLNNKSLWSNTLGGDRYAVGMGGNIMGRHAHVTVIDDPLDPRGGRSDAKIKEASHYCTETLPSRKVDKEKAWTALVMQRISVDDPTALFLERGNIEHICLPGEETDDIRPAELRANYKDGLFDPTRLTHKSMLEFRKNMGEYGYAGQILQRPVPLGGGMFQIDKITEHYAAPPHSDFQKVVRFWDRAASDGKGDYSVGVKMGLHKDGTYWILDVVRGQWASDERERMIHSVAENDGKLVRIGLEQEPGSSGIDSVKETIRRLSGFLVNAEKATGDKVTRADTFSVQVNIGNVKMVRGGWGLEYKYEVQHFPNGKHDDQVDATSGAFSMLINKKVRLGVLK